MLASRVSPRTTFRPAVGVKPRSAVLSKAVITQGVEFDTIAREWRLKWSADNDKAALAEVQKKLEEVKSEIKGVSGVKSVQRIVCGGCLDYKVVIALKADEYAKWEAAKFQPEEKFLSAVKAIPGVSQVETQTYTIMPVDM